MKERIGKRKERKYNIRQEKLGYYVIVTDTAETEKNYFEGLKIRLRSKLFITYQQID